MVPQKVVLHSSAESLVVIKTMYPLACLKEMRENTKSLARTYVDKSGKKRSTGKKRVLKESQI